MNIAFDLTTSFGYKGQNAVGIVRTEREIGRAMLQSGLPVQFFRFTADTGALRIISLNEAKDILGIDDSVLDILSEPDRATAAVANDSDLRAFLENIETWADMQISGKSAHSRTIEADETLELFQGDVLVSAGLLWDSNFLEIIFKLKQHVKFFVIQVVYDIVPIVMPEFCVPGMNIRFPKYLLDVAWTADAVFCISDSTLSDLRGYLLARDLPMPELCRMQLGVDFTNKGEVSSSLSRLLRPGRFVVYVSTIEPRKNHALLFHVWRLLYERNRDVLVPLVIVGRQGWNSADLLTMIQAAEHLHPEYIKTLTEVSDADLDWLYRNSSFTVYPSFYEGWGLPVAESLARGKFCIASATSSILEAGAGQAELLDPFDILSWAERIEHYLTWPQNVRDREKLIKTNYITVRWPRAMQDFISALEHQITRLGAIEVGH